MGRNRSEKTIDVAGRKVTIKEVPVIQVLALHKDGDLSLEKVDDLLQDITGLSLEELYEFYPSELDKLWQTFTEVNSFFFKASKLLGLEHLLPRLAVVLIEVIGTTFGGEFASFMRLAMTEPSPTDGAGS